MGITFAQLLASANAPWTRTIDGLGRGAAATEATARSVTSISFIGPPWLVVRLRGRKRAVDHTKVSTDTLVSPRRAGGRPRRSAMRTRSASDLAPIFRMTLPRWAL